jgi:hypothetical protein
MDELINIENILNGTPPFSLYVCNVEGNECIYIQTITNDQVPYSFNLPTPFINSNFSIKIIDNNQCELIKYFN